MENGAEIFVSSLEVPPGRRIAADYGLVQGSTVQSRHLGRDILAGLKNIVGGELRSYTQLLEKARAEAVSRMVEEARARGANAVVNVRFSTATVTEGAAEILAYGTAVTLE
ncbi:MAG: YbjQ family protein [Parvularculaceae bacterium]